MRTTTATPPTGTGPQVFYLSQLIGAAIVDADGHRLGVLGDVAVDLRETLPRVTGVWMRGDRSRVALIPRDAIAEFHLSAVWLKVARRYLQPRPLQPDEQLLGEVLDSQVVDTDGLKVVRVNDLQLMRTDGDLRLLAADVGTTGLLRRLNLESPVQYLARALGRRLPDRIIPWRMVAAFGGQMTPVKLSISRERLREIHPADLAQLMGDLDRDERVEVMTALEHEAAADALAEAEPEVQADVVQSLPSELAADILDEMSPDDATDVLTDLPAEKVDELIGLMEAEEAKDVRELLKFPEGTAGSVMTTEFIAFPETLTVDETIQRLRGAPPEAEQIYYLYVVDAQQRLVGVLPLRALITSPPSQRIGDVMASGVVYLSVTDSVETGASALTKYDLLAMPVLDESLRLAGVVTVDDVMEIVLRKGRRRVPPRFRKRAKPRTGRSQGQTQ